MPDEIDVGAPLPPWETGSAHDAAALRDDVAARILASLRPLRFREATSAPEREACLRLRYQAVIERRLATAESFPDGLESDGFDADAVHVLGSDGSRPIAASRIVLPAAGRPLPTEAAFGVQLPAAAVIVEWGRIVVDPDYRGDGHRVFMGLAARCWLSTRARGYTTVIGATPKRLVAMFDALGFPVTVLGAARQYWGEERHPILFGSYAPRDDQ